MPARQTHPAEGESMTLAQLEPGQKARVLEVLADGFLRRRLLDLGLVPGTIVEAVLDSPLGDPVAYNIRGSVIALRDDDAKGVIVENA
jgi:ferrous iron transport protein A